MESRRRQGSVLPTSVEQDMGSCTAVEDDLEPDDREPGETSLDYLDNQPRDENSDPEVETLTSSPSHSLFCSL